MLFLAAAMPSRGAPPRKKNVYSGTAAERPDGVYRANIDFDGMATTSYQKTGAVVRGTLYNGFRNICYQGTLHGNTVRNDRLVLLDLDFKTRPPTQRAINMLSEYPVGRLTTAPLPVTLTFDVPLQVCLEYFKSKPIEDLPPAPCDDETLRPAMKTANQFPTYLDLIPTTICEVEDDPDNCTVEKVFELMIGTPAAIGPAKDPESQTVEDCGVLVLDAFTDPLLPKRYEMPNRIKVDIDEEHHRVTNYTLPGHVFWPGLVIREIVERNGKIGVKTTGYGHEGIIKKWLVNLPTAGLAWAFCDGVLIGTYKKTYGEAKPDDDNQ